MFTENNEQKANHQTILVDKSFTGKNLPWRTKAIAKEQLEAIYATFDLKKANRLRNCANVLSYQTLENGQKRLKNANFCRCRLCPMCVWRRTLKIFAQTSKIVNELDRINNFEYVFITLTVKNCRSENLNETINSMMKAWSKLRHDRTFKNIVKGFYRGFEITHKLDKTSENYDTYHPHFHCVFVVSKSHFKDNFAKKEKWSELWQRALKIEYNPVLDIQKIKTQLKNTVAEITKYSVKETDCIIENDINFSVKIVKLLDRVLHKRRFVAFGGLFKDLHKKLNLNYSKQDKLKNYKNKNEEKPQNNREETYFWHTGCKQFLKTPNPNGLS